MHHPAEFCRPTHSANPVMVEAHVITRVSSMPDGCAVLTLDNGFNALASVAMMARFTPAVGDYHVRQQDGYEYLNPKAVFERKYAPLPRVETGNLTDKPTALVNFNQADRLTPELEKTVEDAFSYHDWSEDQIAAGQRVRNALQLAFLQIIRDVPPGPDRSVALRKLREARMDANSAITHGGKY